LLGGCARTPGDAVASGSPADYQNLQLRQQRESAMNQRWQNHRYSELVAVMGQPVRLLNIPGGGEPPGFAAYYGRDAASGCFDAFALVNGEDPVVRVYYCR
jgi:hypothetical protein